MLESNVSCGDLFVVGELNAHFDKPSFSDMLELYVSCGDLFVVGELNAHFDKPSDPSTSALSIVLDNLSLHQLHRSTYPPPRPLFRLADNKSCD